MSSIVHLSVKKFYPPYEFGPLVTASLLLIETCKDTNNVPITTLFFIKKPENNWQIYNSM